MGTYNSAVITNGGQSMIAQAVAGASLEFTTIKTSNYAYPAGTNLATLTTINGIKQSKDITSATVYNSRVIKISAAVDNTGISTAYTINAIGIYAKVGSSAESLFAVVTASAADTMPAYSNKPYSYIYEINLTMQNAANMTVTVNAAGLVNVADLNAAKFEIQGEIADLRSDLIYKADKVYGGTTSASYLVCTAGKTWHSTLGTLVNNTKRAVSEQIKFTPDMQKFDVISTYRMIVYGNNDGIGNPLTQVSGTGVITYNMASFPYKYIYIVILKQDQSEIDSDLTDVLSLSKYDHALPFALEQDITQIETDIDNTGTVIRNVEADTGIYHINLFTDNLVNMGVSGTTGEPMGANNARCCNSELLPLTPNVPLYIDRPSTGFFKPCLYLFNDGVFTGTVITNFANGNCYDADGIRFLFFKNPNTADISAQDVVDNFTIYQEASDSLNNRVKELEGGNDYSLIAYGDSLTTGAGASSSAKTYWAVCATQLGMKSRIGFGFGGSQSKAIAWTAGALSAYIPPNLNTFALKYADLTSNVSIAANALSGKTVVVDGAEYVITQTGVTEYSLPNTYTPSDVYLPIINKNSRYKADVYVIWVGTNDGSMQWDIIDAMIAKLPHKKYVVMGLTRLGTDTTVEDEDKAYTKYGSHYFNTRMQIISNAFAVLGTTPTAEDEAAISSGLMPPSLLSDSTHFNDSGYEVIGKLLAMHIKSLGYTFQIA